jgi:hypothetical protein
VGKQTCLTVCVQVWDMDKNGITEQTLSTHYTRKLTRQKPRLVSFKLKANDQPLFAYLLHSSLL